MKKKLSLLLAAMLVMTLVPMSSFAVKTEVSTVKGIEAGTSAVHSVYVQFEEQSYDVFSTGTLQFEINGASGVEFKNKPSISTGGTNAGATLTEVNYNGNLAWGKATINNNDANKETVEFKFDLDFSDAVEGEDVKITMTDMSAKETGLTGNFTVATVKAAASTNTLAITVKESDKTISLKGGALSQFTVKNFKNAIVSNIDEVTVELDNGAKFTSDTKVFVDGVVKTVDTNGVSSFKVDGLTKTTDSIVVVPDVTAVNSDFEDVNVTVSTTRSNSGNYQYEEYSSSAKIGSVVDYGVTVKVVENGKKEIPTLLGGKVTTLKMTFSGATGSITDARDYYITLDGAKVNYTATETAKDSGRFLNGKVSLDDSTNVKEATVKSPTSVNGKTDVFTLVPNTADGKKMEIIVDVYVSADAPDGIATMTVSSRDLKEDIVVDIANVEKAFDVDTKVTEYKRGESGEGEDIVITETKAGQLNTNEYLYVVYNGKILMNEKPEIEGTNGLKFGKVEWVKDDNKDTVGFRAKVEGKSKSEPGEITVSGMTVDMAYNAIHERVYTASLYVGTTDIKDYDTLVDSIKAAEFDEIDYAKCVAEYATVKSTVVFTLGSANYTVDGVVKTLEAPVFTKDNRTMLPIGPLALALGLEVNYNADTQTATFRDARTGQVVSVKENASVLYNNGIEYKMHTAAVTVNGRIFIPVASITDAFGAQITWDEATQTVTIVK